MAETREKFLLSKSMRYVQVSRDMSVHTKRREMLLQKLSKTVFYGIIDAGYVKEAEMAVVARQLVAGGAGVIQLRAKQWSEERILEKARELREVCRQVDVIFVVNDYAKIAAEVEADGLHVGQEDGSLASAREIVGEGVIVGRSTHSHSQAVAAAEEGFDYIGFGPLFPTPTKQGRPGIGLDNVSAVCDELDLPVFCIGGIKQENIDLVANAGAMRVVVVSDVLLADDRKAAVGSVVEALKALDKSSG